MTHEREPNEEAAGGPEHDESLPNAWEVPVADGPDDLAPMTDEDDWDTDG